MHFFIRVKAERRHDGFGELMGVDREQFGSIEEQDLCLRGVRLLVRQFWALELALPRGIVAHCPRQCSTCAAGPEHKGGLHNCNYSMGDSTCTLWWVTVLTEFYGFYMLTI